MVHHYAYVTKVVEICEPESYKGAKDDTKWRVAMEEEMRRDSEDIHP